MCGVGGAFSSLPGSPRLRPHHYVREGLFRNIGFDIWFETDAVEQMQPLLDGSVMVLRQASRSQQGAEAIGGHAGVEAPARGNVRHPQDATWTAASR